MAVVACFDETSVALGVDVMARVEERVKNGRYLVRRFLSIETRAWGSDALCFVADFCQVEENRVNRRDSRLREYLQTISYLNTSHKSHDIPITYSKNQQEIESTRPFPQYNRRIQRTF